jgi:hypothetical protein
MDELEDLRRLESQLRRQLAGVRRQIEAIEEQQRAEAIEEQQRAGAPPFNPFDDLISSHYAGMRSTMSPDQLAAFNERPPSRGGMNRPPSPRPRSRSPRSGSFRPPSPRDQF